MSGNRPYILLVCLLSAILLRHAPASAEALACNSEIFSKDIQTDSQESAKIDQASLVVSQLRGGLIGTLLRYKLFPLTDSIPKLMLPFRQITAPKSIDTMIDFISLRAQLNCGLAELSIPDLPPSAKKEWRQHYWSDAAKYLLQHRDYNLWRLQRTYRLSKAQAQDAFSTLYLIFTHPDEAETQFNQLRSDLLGKLTKHDQALQKYVTEDSVIAKFDWRVTHWTAISFYLMAASYLGSSIMYDNPINVHYIWAATVGLFGVRMHLRGKDRTKAQEAYSPLQDLAISIDYDAQSLPRPEIKIDDLLASLNEQTDSSLQHILSDLDPEFNATQKSRSIALIKVILRGISLENTPWGESLDVFFKEHMMRKELKPDEKARIESTLLDRRQKYMKLASIFDRLEGRNFSEQRQLEMVKALIRSDINSITSCLNAMTSGSLGLLNKIRWQESLRSQLQALRRGGI